LHTKKRHKITIKDFTGNINGFNGATTVPFLNQFYKIQSNKGSSNITQSVFETVQEKFSQTDLAAFQNRIGATLQPAIDRSGGLWTSEICYSSKNNDPNNPSCLEGNLDTQYIMGVAQNTATIYWYDGDGNAFLSWITDVANSASPPLSNSISWGAIEQIYFDARSKYMSTPFLFQFNFFASFVLLILYVFTSISTLHFAASRCGHYEFFQQRGY
jgi:hypothetical protein